MADDARLAELRGLMAEALRGRRVQSTVRDEITDWSAADLADALLPHAERFAAEQVAAALASVLDLADELDREADTYAASVELLPTPTERASAAARVISHGGAAERIRARARAAAALAAPDNDRRQG